MKPRPYEEKRFRNVPRWYELLDGTRFRVRLTRYTYQYGVRKVRKSKVKAYETFARNVYYMDGVFYKTQKIQLGETRYKNTIVPISGRIWDCHPNQSDEQGIPVLTITCMEGRPIKAEHQDFGVVWEEVDGLHELEEWLHLEDCPESRRCA